jgi:hypothetical protein
MNESTVIAGGIVGAALGAVLGAIGAFKLAALAVRSFAV